MKIPGRKNGNGPRRNDVSPPILHRSPPMSSRDEWVGRAARVGHRGSVATRCACQPGERGHGVAPRRSGAAGCPRRGHRDRSRHCRRLCCFARRRWPAVVRPDARTFHSPPRWQTPGRSISAEADLRHGRKLTAAGSRWKANVSPASDRSPGLRKNALYGFVDSAHRNPVEFLRPVAELFVRSHQFLAVFCLA